MALVVFNYEGGSNGAALTAALSGTGASNPVVDAGGSATFSNDAPYQGLLCGRYAYPASGGTGVFQQHAFQTAAALIAYTFAFRLKSTVTGNTSATIAQFRSSGGLVFTERIVWDTGVPTLRLFVGATDLGQIGTGSLAVNTWYRASGEVNGTTGAYTTRLRNGTTDALIGSAKSGTEAGMVATYANTRVGNSAVLAQAVTVDIDWLCLNDGGTSELPMPVLALDTPVVTVTGTTNPTTIGGEDGTITATWAAITNADHYEAAIADGDVTTGYTTVSTAATSPYVFTGVDAGVHTVAIRAIPA